MSNLIQVDTNLQTQDWCDERDCLMSTALVAQKNGITGNDQLQESVRLQTAMSKHIKLLSADRLRLTRQIDAISKQVRDKEKELVSGLVKAKDDLQRANSAYVKAQQDEATRVAKEAERQAAEDQAEREANAAKFFGDAAQVQDVAPPPPPPPQTKLAAGRVVKVHNITITDESLLARELTSPDMKKIRAFVKYRASTNGSLDIPGLSVSETVQVNAK